MRSECGWALTMERVPRQLKLWNSMPGWIDLHYDRTVARHPVPHIFDLK